MIFPKKKKKKSKKQTKKERKRKKQKKLKRQQACSFSRLQGDKLVFVRCSVCGGKFVVSKSVCMRGCTTARLFGAFQRTG